MGLPIRRLAAAAVLCWLALGAGDAAALPRAACPPAGADIVERGHGAVAYVHGSALRGCLVRDRIHRRLGYARDAGGTVAVAGRFVAFRYDQGCAVFSDACESVVVADLRSGRRLASLAQRDDPPRVVKIVVDARGRAAWLRRGIGFRELRKMDSDGEEALDRRRPIGAIRIERGVLRWRSAGRARRFALDRNRPCSRRGSVTLARNRLARVYRLGDEAFGCLIAGGRPFAIGAQQSLDDDVGSGPGRHIHLAGRFVSIDLGGSYRGSSARLRVWDLARRRLHYRWDCCAHANGWIDNVLLHESGAVAWAGEYQPEARGYVAEVRKTDSTGAAILLDSAPAPGPLDTRSLALDGRTFTWRHAGETRTAELR